MAAVRVKNQMGAWKVLCHLNGGYGSVSSESSSLELSLL